MVLKYLTLGTTISDALNKQIDTVSAEYPACTNYLYLTYNGVHNDIPPGNNAVLSVLALLVQKYTY